MNEYIKYRFSKYVLIIYGGIVLTCHLTSSLLFNPYDGSMKYQDIVTLVGIPATALHYKLQL